MFRSRMLMANVLVLVSLVSGPVTLAAAPGNDDVQAAVPERASVKHLFTEPTLYDPAEQHHHPIPDRPVVIDGVKHHATEIGKFDGRPLSFLLNADAEAEGVIYVFTSRAKLHTYLNEHNSLPSDMPRAGQAQSTTGDMSPMHQNWNDPHSYFYEDPEFGGCSLALHIGKAYPDLRRVGCGVWPWYRNYNDRFSSVKATPQGRYTVLWEHINYGGSYVMLAPGSDVTNLGWASNFDDRASSIAVYY